MAEADAYTVPFNITKTYHRDVYPGLDPSKPELSAGGKTVIITGAGGQIGSDIAAAWAQASASTIVLLGRNTETLNETSERVKGISSSSKVVVYQLDVTLEDPVKAFYEKLTAEHKPTDAVLINNAGAMTPSMIAGGNAAAWWGDFEANIKGPFLMSQHFISSFAGKGTIVNINSFLISMALPALSSYSMSKLALAKFTEFLQAENPDLRVFSLMPGLVNSNMTQEVVKPFSKDSGVLTGAWSLYMSTAKADYLKSGLVNVNWDVDELEKHKDEITEKKLVNLAFLNAKLGPEGYPWAS